jgi:hypothetical protein
LRARQNGKQVGKGKTLTGLFALHEDVLLGKPGEIAPRADSMPAGLALVLLC